MKNISINYYVEYIDNNICNSDIWSQRTLNDELVRGDVKITYIELAHSTKVALGLIDED